VLDAMCITQIDEAFKLSFPVQMWCLYEYMPNLGDSFVKVLFVPEIFYRCISIKSLENVS